mmetsp:Transcript_9992/g.26515  ORF Transcript_9992/g.26515 Transcript_9992/m.26515 type:complete len:235 (-) Transcript_9992:983-1687(-)
MAPHALRADQVNDHVRDVFPVAFHLLLHYLRRGFLYRVPVDEPRVAETREGRRRLRLPLRPFCLRILLDRRQGETRRRCRRARFEPLLVSRWLGVGGNFNSADFRGEDQLFQPALEDLCAGAGHRAFRSRWPGVTPSSSKADVESRCRIGPWEQTADIGLPDGDNYEFTGFDHIQGRRLRSRPPGAAGRVAVQIPSLRSGLGVHRAVDCTLGFQSHVPACELVGGGILADLRPH